MGSIAFDLNKNIKPSERVRLAHFPLRIPSPPGALIWFAAPADYISVFRSHKVNSWDHPSPRILSNMVLILPCNSAHLTALLVIVHLSPSDELQNKLEHCHLSSLRSCETDEMFSVIGLLPHISSYVWNCNTWALNDGWCFSVADWI